MPVLLRRIEPNIAFTDQALYERAADTEVLDNIDHAYKVGTIAQLAMLSSMAHEIFSGILVESNFLAARIQSIAKKTDYICAIVYKQSTDLANYTPPEVISSDKSILAGQLLSKSSMPTQLKDRYASIQVLPPLHEIDQFMGKTQLQKLGPSASNYSDSTSFLNKWITQQEKNIDRSRDERVTKKAERRANRQMQRDVNNNNVNSFREKKKGVNWRERYIFLL